MASPDMENIITDFESVRAFVVERFPDFNNVSLHFCDDADEMYLASAEEKGKVGALPRVYAHALHYPNTVCVTPMAAELSSEQRQGIFIHEFGHIFCERYPYHEGVDHPLDAEDDGDADYVVTHVFEVHLHYDDDDIEYVKLPIGSEPINEEDRLSDEEIDEIIAGIPEEEEEEEHDEYALGLPSSGDLAPSIEAETLTPEETGEIDLPDDAPVIDVEPENE